MSTSTLPAVVQVYATMNSGNSTFLFDPMTGATGWEVDGVNQLNKQAFFYRIGTTGPEYNIATLGAPTVSQADSEHLDLTYANTQYSVALHYTLTGNQNGSGNSGLSLTLAARNLTSADNQDFHLFQYSDFNLGGMTGNQVATFNNAKGYFSDLTQTLGSLNLANSWTRLNGPKTVEAALCNSTLTSLEDEGLTTLSGVLANNIGDATYTVEWNKSLKAYNTFGDTLAVSETFVLNVPEPSVLALVVPGIFGLALFRRRNKARR